MDQSHRPAQAQPSPVAQSGQAQAPGLEDQELYGNAFLQQQLDAGNEPDGSPDAVSDVDADIESDGGSAVDGTADLGSGDATALATPTDGGGANTDIGSVVNTTYNITGRTLDDVVKTIDAQGEAGELDWKASYKWGRTKHHRIHDVTVTVKRTKKMPVWSAYKEAPAAAQKEWDRFHGALDVHENGHATLVENGWASFADQMEGQTGSKARRRFTKKLKQVRKDDKAYDARTKHGATQGAVLDANKDPRH